jgi:AraC family transcriptional activator of pobA
VSTPRLVTNLPRHDWIAVRRFTPEASTPRKAVVHDHASIALYLDGRAKFWMQGLYTVGAGDLLIVPEATPHYVVEASGVRSIGASLCLTCAPTQVRGPLTDVFDAVRRGGCAARRLTPDDTARVERILVDLEREVRGDRIGSTLAVDAFVALLTVTLLRAAEGERVRQRASVSPVVTRALEFVQRRGPSGISLRHVAEHVGRSPAHVASLVKDATGATVVSWITRTRMSECRQLLLHTDEAVEVIAERCGFASASHFHRAFKRAHGMPPGEWRRAHRP